MHITVEVRSVYGNELVYPACEASHTFARLIGAKTFNAHQIACIRALSYQVHEAYGRALPAGF